MTPRNRINRRKPVLLLDSDGKRRHPLVVLAGRLTMGDIGRLLGHANHTTASIYINRARKAPTTTIPAEWVLALARKLDVQPCALRPDLYLSSWTLPALPAFKGKPVDNANGD